MQPTTDLSLIISGSIGASILLAAVAATWLVRLRNPAHRRLQTMIDQAGAAPGGQKLEAPNLGQLIVNLFSRFSKSNGRKKNWQEAKVRRDLVTAGFRSPAAVNIFIALKVVSALLTPVAVMASPLSQKFTGPMLIAILLGAAALGLVLPSFILDKIGLARREKITKELPDVLDLLVISVEAGLGLDAAINRVAQELSSSSPIMAQELVLMGLELRGGIPREMALNNLAARCDVEDVSGLVSLLNQADRFGVSIGRSIRIQSDAVRTRRKQLLEEKAAKIPLKLLFPVLFLIFPAIIIVISGPAILRVMDTIIK